MRVTFQVGIVLKVRHTEVRCRYLAWPSSNPFSQANRQLPTRPSMRTRAWRRAPRRGRWQVLGVARVDPVLAGDPPVAHAVVDADAGGELVAAPLLGELVVDRGRVLAAAAPHPPAPRHARSA